MRCARPFYEYEVEYHHYWYAVGGTEHWPMLYWKQDHDRDGKEVNEPQRAPQPFHEPDFWTRGVVQPHSASGKAVPKAPEAADFGYHNWLTKRFKIRDPDTPLQGHQSLPALRVQVHASRGALTALVGAATESGR